MRLADDGRSLMSNDESPDFGSESERKRRAVIEPLEIETLRTESAFEHISAAIVELCNVSMAHVSVMEEDRQCVIGRVGFERDHFARDQSFCAHTLSCRELTVVEDATEDEQFENSPYVVEAPHIEFYVGVPLEIQGIPAGTLCAMDDSPREFDERMRATLVELARLVERFLETKAVADSPDDPRHRLTAEMTSIAAFTGLLDARLSSEEGAGELVGGLKDSIDASHDAISDWIEREHEALYD